MPVAFRVPLPLPRTPPRSPPRTPPRPGEPSAPEVPSDPTPLPDGDIDLSTLPDSQLEILGQLSDEVLTNLGLSPQAVRQEIRRRAQARTRTRQRRRTQEDQVVTIRGGMDAAMEVMFRRGALVGDIQTLETQLEFALRRKALFQGNPKRFFGQLNRVKP